MRNYLIIVEGAHDIAVIEKLLRLNGVKKRLLRKKNCRIYGGIRFRQGIRFMQTD